MKEFTRKEFNEFIQKNELESFSSTQVEKFQKSILSNLEDLDDFQKSCIAAEVQTLEKAIVVEDNLTKSLVFYRPIQVEPTEENGLFNSNLMKSKSLRYKDTPLNRFKGVVGLLVDNDVIEKARKAEPLGTEKTYGGKLYVKTANGWRPKANKSQEPSKESKETPLNVQVTRAQYGGDRKEELGGEIAKLRFKLMKKYGNHGSYWERAARDAKDPDAKRLQSLNLRFNELKNTEKQSKD